MSDFVITTDMTADLPEGYLKERNIDIVSMPFTVDGKEYGRETAPCFHDFYDMLRGGGLTTTSQISAYDAIEIFNRHLLKGEDILHISFSSGMSGSVETLEGIKKMLLEKFPERKITIVDSLSGAGGEGLMVYYALKMKEAGKSMDEISGWCVENKLNFHHFFIVQDLDFLCRGGRLSKVEAFIGSLLNIRPVLALSQKGKITPVLKALGNRKAMNAMAAQLNEYCVSNFKNDFLLVGHGDDIESAQIFAEKVRELYPDFEIRYANVDYLAGSHAGPNSLAIYFVGEKRKLLGGVI